MSVKVGSARLDERGRITGGTAGDQNGKEVSTQAYYLHSKGWRIFRCIDPAKALKIAECMMSACANDMIGYDQDQRSSLYKLAKQFGFDVSRVKTPTETDCSALVRVCCAYAGIMLDDFSTSSESSVLLRSGMFIELTDEKYTKSKNGEHALAGDILVTRPTGHTVVVLNDGAKATRSSTSTGTSETTGTKIKIVDGQCYVRSAPNTSGEILGIARRDSVHEYLGEKSSDGWLKIKFESGSGWVSGVYARLEG